MSIIYKNDTILLFLFLFFRFWQFGDFQLLYFHMDFNFCYCTYSGIIIIIIKLDLLLCVCLICIYLHNYCLFTQYMQCYQICLYIYIFVNWICYLHLVYLYSVYFTCYLNLVYRNYLDEFQLMMCINTCTTIFSFCIKV